MLSFIYLSYKSNLKEVIIRSSCNYPLTALWERVSALLQYLNILHFLIPPLFLNLWYTFYSKLFYHWYKDLLSRVKNYCYSSLLLSIHFITGNYSHLFRVGKHFLIAFLHMVYTDLLEDTYSSQSNRDCCYLFLIPL